MYPNLSLLQTRRGILTKSQNVPVDGTVRHIADVARIRRMIAGQRDPRMMLLSLINTIDKQYSFRYWESAHTNNEEKNRYNVFPVYGSHQTEAERYSDYYDSRRRERAVKTSNGALQLLRDVQREDRKEKSLDDDDIPHEMSAKEKYDEYAARTPPIVYHPWKYPTGFYLTQAEADEGHRLPAAMHAFGYSIPSIYVHGNAFQMLDTWREEEGDRETLLKKGEFEIAVPPLKVDYFCLPLRAANVIRRINYEDINDKTLGGNMKAHPGETVWMCVLGINTQMTDEGNMRYCGSVLYRDHNTKPVAYHNAVEHLLDNCPFLDVNDMRSLSWQQDPQRRFESMQR